MVEGCLMGDLARAQVVPDFKPERTKKIAVRPKPVKREVTPMSVKVERAAWYAAVTKKRLSTVWTAEDYPAICAGEKVELHCHHAISRQECRKHGAPEWDQRNGFPVTKRRHERHHSRIEPLLRGDLPDEVFAFVEEHPKLRRYLDKTYPLETPDTTAVAVVRSGGDL